MALDEDAVKFAAEEEALTREKAGGTVELGPRSLALLRRAVLCLGILAGVDNPLDPGKSFEDGPVNDDTV